MRKAIAVVMIVVILLASVLASVQAANQADIVASHAMYYTDTKVPTVQYVIPGETWYQAWAHIKYNPYRMEIQRCRMAWFIPVDCLTYVLYDDYTWYQESTDFPASRWEPYEHRVTLATDQYYAKLFRMVTHTGVVRCVGGLVCVVEEEGFPYPPPGGEGMRAIDPTPTDEPVIKSKKTKVPAYP